MPAPSLVPPGFTFIANVAPGILASTALVVLTNRYAPIRVSGLAWAGLFIAFVPIYATFKRVIRNIIWARESKKMGARMAPFHQRTAYTMGLDLIYQMLQNFSYGCLGDPLPGIPDEIRNTFSLNVFGDYIFMTSEPDHLKTILATDFDSFEKGESFRRDHNSVLGTGVFNSDGDMWKFHRGMTRPFFARERITDFDLFDHHCNIAISKMKERLAEGEAIDFQDVISRFTLDSATDFLFGSCVNSLSAPLPYAWNSSKSHPADKRHPSDLFARAFADAQNVVSRRSRQLDFWLLAEFFRDKSRKPMSTIYEYIDPILKDALARKTSGETKHQSFSNAEEAKSDTLLDDLLLEVDDFDVIRDEIVNIMIAGRDTTMATITFAVYCLSQNPQHFETLRREIMSVVGPYRRPTPGDLKACKYLRAVINETLRLYPPVPFNIRRSKRNTTLPSRDGKPFFVPGGTDISYSVLFMHRREDLWGPDALIFDPARFLDERLHKYLIPNPFIFLPFNAGPRICLGQQFAYNEVSYTLIKLLQEFDSIELDAVAQPPDSRPPPAWKNEPGLKGREKIWPKTHLTLYSHKGLWLRMKTAEEKNSTS